MRPFEIEMALVHVLKTMEDTGVLLDTNLLTEIGHELRGHMAGFEREWEQSFPSVSITSPVQIREHFFGWQLWPEHAEGLEWTDKGVLSTNADNVEIVLNHPDTTEEGRKAAKLLTDHAEYKTIYNTFTHALVAKAQQHTDGRLHCSYRQHGTVTSRFSCADPHLQNIPKRSAIGARLREAFIAAPGRVLICADYSRLELTVLAHYIGKGMLVDIIMAGTDPFQAIADELGVERSPIKNAIYAILYGGGARRIAKTAGIPYDEADALLRRINHDFEISGYNKRAIAFAKKNGISRTMGGYTRTIPNIHSTNRYKKSQAERQAKNTPIQGTAAWIVKLAMLETHKRLVLPKRSWLLMQVHDEVVMSSPSSTVEEDAAILQDCLENTVKLKVPLRAEPHWGPNWTVAKGD